MTKKIFAVLMAVFMLVTCFSFTAAAADTVSVVSATMDSELYKATVTFSEAVHVFKTGYIWLCTKPEPAGTIKENNATIGYDQYGVSSVKYVNPTLTDGLEYSKTVEITFNRPGAGEFIFKKNDPASPDNVGVRIVEYFLGDTVEGVVSPQAVATADGRGLDANYRTGDGNDICWIPTEAWAQAMKDRGWGGFVDRVDGGAVMKLTSDGTFKVVSASLDTDKFAVTFEFSKPIHIFDKGHIWFCTRPTPAGAIKENNTAIGYDQYGVKSVEYISPTLVGGQEYSKTVTITFNKPASPNDFIFLKGDVASPTQAGVRFVEYNYSSTDGGNGTVSPSVMRTANGEELIANFKSGQVDICWVPASDWADAMTSRGWAASYVNDYTYNVVMSTVKPEIAVINTANADLGKIEVFFTQRVTLQSGYQMDLGGVKSTSVTKSDLAGYSYVFDFGQNVVGKTAYSIPADMFKTSTGISLGATREGDVRSHSTATFDDISDKFEIGALYSFMNTDTGRMLTVDGKTEFKLEYFAASNKYALVDANGRYINLQTLRLSENRHTFDLVLNNEYERYQIVVGGSQVLLDDDTGNTNAAVIAYAEYGTDTIETGWYMTKSGEELPKKFVCIGDSITCGVIPTADNGGSAVKPGYRKELSEMLLEEYGRVVFVGNLKHARGGNTTAIDNTRITDGFLYRHEGHSGWVIETGHYPNASAPDNNRGIADLREGLQTKYAPDVILMMIGINDVGMMGAYNGDDAKLTTIANRWETLVRDMLDDLPEDGLLLGASLTPRASGSSWSTSQNDAIAKLNAKYKAVIDEINAEGDMRLVKADNFTYVMNAGTGAISSDTIHLTPTGFTALANSYFDTYKSVMDARAEAPEKNADFDADGDTDADDAIYLLYNIFFGDEEYPITSDADVNSDTKTDADDAIYLLYNIFFGDEEYPLYPNATDDDGGDESDDEWTGNY